MEEDNESLVSVIIPTYNRPGLLSRAIQSVVDQTYDHIELIVVDDCSPNPPQETVVDGYSEVNIGSVVDEFKNETFEKVSFIKHTENKGGNAARATGIKNATGDFLAFLDDDDRWVPEKTEKQIKAFQEAPDSVGLMYSGTENENIDRVDKPSIRGEVEKEILLKNFVGTYSSVMVSNDVVDTVGLPDERFPCDQDWEWYVRIAQRYSFEYVSDILVERGGATDEYDQVSGDVDLKAEAVHSFIKKYEDTAAEYGGMFSRKWRANVLFRVAYIAFMKDRYSLSRRFCLQSIWYNPFVWRYYVTLLLTVFDRPLKAVYHRLPLSIRRKIGRAIRFG